MRVKTSLALGLGVALGLGSSSCARKDRPPPPVAQAIASPAAASASVAPPARDVPGCPPLDATELHIPFGAEEMVPLCHDFYVEPALTPEERARVAGAYGPARDDVTRGLGPLESPPPVAILCKTDACGVYFGGTARRSSTVAPGGRLTGATYVAGPRLTIVVLGADEGARGILAHETVHAELDVRLRHARAPQWFHEGLAALVGGAPSCAGQEARGIDDLRRLDENAAWVDYTNTTNIMGPTYCQARAEVDAWLRHAGKPALFDLLGKVRDGASFEDAYGSMQTQRPGAIPTVVVSSAPALGDGGKPFTLAMWIKPREQVGVLAHVSATPVGTGWCGPFLGYDREKRLVSQLVRGDGPDLASFAVAVDTKPRPLGQWTHVAMTWAPGSENRLYVDGALAAVAPAPRYAAHGAGAPMYVAWGSSNVGGAACWLGAITPGTFPGSVTGTFVYDTALDANAIAALARTPP
jgi:hypothetical protein